jgi:hypothetical protein
MQSGSGIRLGGPVIAGSSHHRCCPRKGSQPKQNTTNHSLIGLWDRYEQETKALRFSGLYERYLASQAGFADDQRPIVQ